MELSVNDLWFTEELDPLEEYSEEIIKELARTTKLDEKEVATQLTGLINKRNPEGR